VGDELMIFGHSKKLLKKLDTMLDDALAGTYNAQSYDERILSKIESKMSRFLDASRLRREQIKREQERVHSLISDISHQTKTPLSNITLYTGLLAEQDLSEEQSALLEQVAVSAEKLEFLIGSLVKASRLESGIIKIELKNGSVSGLVDSVISECKKTADDKGIRLLRDYSSASISALFDPRWCAEALVNIIDNAVKYSSEGGSIEISVIPYEMFACVNISDTGRGIREEDLPKVFGRFWRAAESGGIPGVGVGLYLAREIITACGGYIKVNSEIGKGSTFSVFLSKV
jgi:signal transduction histidine kinase